MDKIILGLLMLRRLTIYEIRANIARSFKDICSDSTGSIQAAIKKLLASGMVTYDEYVERSVNKKQYSITNKGREAFSEWVQTPAVLSGGKNMEVGKLVFMGLMPAEKRLPLIDEMIAMLETELSFYAAFHASIEWASATDQAMDYWAGDPEYLEGVQNATQNADMSENVRNIGRYQLFALEYGIEGLKFHIEWLKKLKMREEDQTHEIGK